MRTPTLIAVLIIFSLLFVGCSKTAVVKIDGTKENKTEAPAPKPVNQTPEPKQPVQTTNVTGKVPVKCTDSDANDKFTSGRVTVTYSDGSKNDFIDECPVKNEVFQLEYVCDGNKEDSKINTCGSPCIAGLCLD
jgi:hypothetical protein